MINECFSKATVESILSSLVDISMKNEDKLILHAIRSMKYGSPTNLKIFLKLIREGRMQNLEKCFVHDYNVNLSIRFQNDATEVVILFLIYLNCYPIINVHIFKHKQGIRAMLIERDKKPQWNPSTLEEVKEETVKKCFEELEDVEFEPLVLDASRTLNDGLISTTRPKL
ncbi:3-hydroxyisobutyryl-CoA hydrolase-like protein 5 [Impatiens glandulifera]|uniref:3-hydroxyisobutyryl-CoA hydrolase-like protein 5 n=1 Tax=Impatiens glandulifera TaxID=253017 RepID=UPI001FB175AD|nr:3-hydroxyisobutyryl-CoA hydrolase-like protein 5 [Impatiens glandulifera]